MAKKLDETGGLPGDPDEGNEPFRTKTTVMKPGDTPDDTDTPALSEKPGVTQAGDEGTFTLTKDELDERINDGRADIGRLLKAQAEETKSVRDMLETVRKESESLRQEREQYLKEQEERELSGVQDKPDVHDALKLKHANRREALKLADERRDLDKQKTEHQADVEYARSVRAKEKAENLGKTYGVDAKLLYSVVGNDPDKMEEIAKVLPKVGSDNHEPEDTASVVKGVRGANLGGKGGSRATWTLQDYEEAYIRGEVSRQKYEEVMRKAGKL